MLEHGDYKTGPATKFFDNVVDVLGMKYTAISGRDPTTIADRVTVHLFSFRWTGGVNGIKGLP